MAGSVPSKLVFLSDLPNLKQGEKVRFLGCIDKYDIPTGTLFLKHGYPRSGRSVVALTSLDMVLDHVEHTTVQVGGWVNVIGYVTEHTPSSCTTEATTQDAACPRHAHVQAIMLWDAAALKLEEYESAVQNRITLGTTG